jgi:predicted nucleic acid-binding protein
MAVVVDASAVVLAINGGPESARVSDRLSESQSNAPHLIDLEVLNALRGLVRGGIIDDWRAQTELADHLALTIVRFPHEPFIARIWELRDNMSPYDAAYVALAEALDTPLITCDSGLAKAAGSLIDVEFFN